MSLPTLDEMGKYLAQPEITNTITAISSVVIAVFTFLVWKVYRRLTWFTGAMERHSDQQRRMVAKQQKIPIVLWDKTIHDWPEDGDHGQRDQVKYIAVGVAPGRRRYRGWRRALKVWDRLLDKYPEMPVLPVTKTKRARQVRKGDAK